MLKFTFKIKRTPNDDWDLIRNRVQVTLRKKLKRRCYVDDGCDVYVMSRDGEERQRLGDVFMHPTKDDTFTFQKVLK